MSVWKTEHICPKCKLLKPAEAYYISVAALGKRDSYCIECQKKRRVLRHHTAEGQAHEKNGSLQRRHGIDLEVYFAMLVSQSGLCAICSEPTSSPSGLSVDHDHRTGRIRGLLCSLCNMGIGNLRDDSVVLRRAVTYLEARV
jgi:hypothetical protein